MLDELARLERGDVASISTWPNSPDRSKEWWILGSGSPVGATSIIETSIQLKDS